VPSLHPVYIEIPQNETCINKPKYILKQIDIKQVSRHVQRLASYIAEAHTGGWTTGRAKFIVLVTTDSQLTERHSQNAQLVIRCNVK